MSRWQAGFVRGVCCEELETGTVAGDWIKMRINLANEPEVIGIAAATGLDEDAVVGKLHRLWSWADQHTVDGNARSVTEIWVDRYTNATGFASAMISVGWLVATPGGILFPNFDRHNGQTGKRRALTKNRVDKSRNAPSVTKALPEKRREEKIINPPLPPENQDADLPANGQSVGGGEDWEKLESAFLAEGVSQAHKAVAHCRRLGLTVLQVRTLGRYHKSQFPEVNGGATYEFFAALTKRKAESILKQAERPP